jgi:hypothetical protein
MNIIEKEIARRKAVIDSKEEKIKTLAELKAEAQALEIEIENINVEELAIEIKELEEYLQKDEDFAEPEDTESHTQYVENY